MILFIRSPPVAELSGRSGHTDQTRRSGPEALCGGCQRSGDPRKPDLTLITRPASPIHQYGGLTPLCADFDVSISPHKSATRQNLTLENCQSRRVSEFSRLLGACSFPVFRSAHASIELAPIARDSIRDAHAIFPVPNCFVQWSGRCNNTGVPHTRRRAMISMRRSHWSPTGRNTTRRAVLAAFNDLFSLLDLPFDKPSEFINSAKSFILGLPLWLISIFNGQIPRAVNRKWIHRCAKRS